MRKPNGAFQSFHLGEESLSLETAEKQAAFHVIGKAPDLIFLGMGHTDLLAGKSSDAMRIAFASLLDLLQAKTQAHIAFASICEAFFPEENQRETARTFNTTLSAFAGPRTRFLDLNSPVNTFLDQHRQGKGEKRALHLSPTRLTSMGRVLLAEILFQQLGWSELFSH